MAPLRRRLATALVLGTAFAAPRAADACGGTFCDSGPQAMPVDQTGENILFVMDGQNVEAHVQIQYQGVAERFAWIVPMPKVPDVSVGSQLLFGSLLQSTVPSYGFSRTFDQCSNSGNGGSGSIGFGGASGGGGMAGGSGADAGGPTVVFRKTVGAFEVTVLEGGTAEQVSGWLSTNGYRDIPAAPSILRDYVDQNFVFAAIKLTGGAGLDEIHPLVFRYPGTEPCVPLKLTAVAAVENMGVRVFFLGDDRVYPANYKHVDLNPARIDWLNFATNYNQVVSRAVDSAVANGQAFVTEYAGPSSVVAPSSVFSSSWSEAPFATIAPENVVKALQDQGLMFCSTTCSLFHPLLAPLLEQYLPPPAGVTADTFYPNIAQYVAQIDRVRWNGAAFAADFKARIVDPGKHASDIVTRWLYLTRMYTTISPAEMTLDPTFHARADLSIDQQPRTSFATQRTTCSGQQAMILPDTREVALASGLGWPIFSSAMPWAERVEEVPASGAVIDLVDNGAKIDEQLALWNKSQGWPPPGAAGSAGRGGSSGRGGAGGSAANGSGGANAVDAIPEGQNAAGGCSCGVASAPAAESLWLALGAAALAKLRRRRRAA
jgi:MYXO-CTERM domain-containing protein